MRGVTWLRCLGRSVLNWISSKDYSCLSRAFQGSCVSDGLSLPTTLKIFKGSDGSTRNVISPRNSSHRDFQAETNRILDDTCHRDKTVKRGAKKQKCKIISILVPRTTQTWGGRLRAAFVAASKWIFPVDCINRQPMKDSPVHTVGTRTVSSWSLLCKLSKAPQRGLIRLYLTPGGRPRKGRMMSDPSAQYLFECLCEVVCSDIRMIRYVAPWEG